MLFRSESNLQETAKELGLNILGRIPIDPAMASLADKGEFERFSNDYLAEAAREIERRFVKAENNK